MWQVCMLLVTNELFNNICYIDFIEEYLPTASSDFAVKEMTCTGNQNISVQVWDVSQNSLGRSFLRGSDAVVSTMN